MTSEECPQYPAPGSVLYTQPIEVDLWCQSIAPGEGFPPTPPDTASDCAVSDCPDMNAPPWSQTSLPEESWNTGPALDHSTYVQSSGGAWHGQQYHGSAQDVRSSGVSPWLSAPQAPVDLGLSPSLSYESQSSHGLYPFSESETAVLPQSLDLSFATEPSWNYAGQPTGPTNAQAVSASPSAGPNHYHSHVEAQPGRIGCSTAPQSFVSQAHHPVYHGPGGYYVHAEPKSTVVHRRPILPRTDAQAVPSQPLYGPHQRELRPQMSMPQASQSSVSTVSTMPGQPSGVQQQTPVSSPGVSSPAAQRLPPAAEPAGLTSRPEFAAQVRPVGPVGYMDHSEDWSSFIQYDHDDQANQQGSTRSGRVFTRPYLSSTDSSSSFTPGYNPGHVAVPNMSSAEAMVLPSDQDAAQGFHGSSTAPTTASGENDEGRHRTHPLYNEGPKADGLYHCPFEEDPNCLHKPTKLKCNYEYV
jgi:hypothetical protein